MRVLFSLLSAGFLKNFESVIVELARARTRRRPPDPHADGARRRRGPRRPPRRGVAERHGELPARRARRLAGAVDRPALLPGLPAVLRPDVPRLLPPAGAGADAAALSPREQGLLHADAAEPPRDAPRPGDRRGRGAGEPGGATLDRLAPARRRDLLALHRPQHRPAQPPARGTRARHPDRRLRRQLGSPDEQVAHAAAARARDGLERDAAARGDARSIASRGRSS